MQEEVSVVIVSMNKLSNLDICLPSIKKYTKVSHKIYIVAYMFSKENIEILKDKYPYVEIIESDQIRGFSENNNLALRKVKSPYTFILNDDTEFEMDVIGTLLSALKNTPEATIMSPVLIRGDKSIQFHGRNKKTFVSFIGAQLGYRPKKSKYEYGSGIYQTYNISGAAFLIKTPVFEKFGFFDEKYFFCPEDIALSTLLNSNGYKCYVDSSCHITHYEGVSSAKSKLFYATKIAAFLGSSYFYGDTKFRRLSIISLWMTKYILYKYLWKISKKTKFKDYAYIYKKVLYAYKKNISCKNAFIDEYNKISNQQTH